MPGLPLLKAPSLIVGTGTAASSSSGFSTRISSRQSQSQPTFIGPSAALLTRNPHGHAPGTRSVAKATATAQPGVERDSSALLLAPVELLAGPQEQDVRQNSVPVSNRTLRNATSRRSTAAARAEKSHAAESPSASASTESDQQQSDPTRSTIVSSVLAQQALEGLPEELHCLLDASSAAAVLPPPGTLDLSQLDNSKLDRLVAALGRGRATWRRALQLYDWLKASSHPLDDRLCTTLIRVCADHGDAVSALGVYEWMRAPVEAGGAGLQPTAYTYTAAMRAALGVGMLDRAMQVWSDSQTANLTPDCRLCITYIEVCTKLGMADKALAMYAQMRDAPPGSPMRPSVHAYTAAMRAATEGGKWTRALGVWEDMRRSGCQPTGHAYAAAISACAAGQDWGRAVALFDDMTSRAGIRPDVVSCTALVTALASAGEADKAEAVVAWMQKNGLKPNVRTYTALLTAMGNACQWQRAVRLLFSMQQPENGSVQPNAYTYSALLKALGEHGQWQLAEAVFEDLEGQVRAARLADALSPGTTAADTAVAAPPADAAQRAVVFKRLLAVAAAAEATESATPMAALQQLGALGMLATGALQLQQLAALQAVAAPATPSLLSPRQPSQPGWAYPAVDSPASGVISPQYMSQSAFQSSPSVSSSGSAAAPATPSSPAQQSSVQDWSHPSQLNGIQLNLHRMSSLTQPLESPAAPVDSVTGPPQTPVANPAPAQPQEADMLAYASAVSPIGSAYHPSLAAAGDSMSGAASSDAASGNASSEFSLFSSQPVGRSTGPSLPPQQQQTDIGPTAVRLGGGKAVTPSTPTSNSTPAANAPLINEVVCGALMLAYERAGKWADAVQVLARARMLGVMPNTGMINTAISAAGKAGQLEVAEQLYESTSAPDMGTYEAMLAAYGMAGRADKAEHLFRTIVRRGLKPRDYAYCGLITAHSMGGNPDAALAIRRRMQRDGYASPASVHVYNALLAACERGGRFDTALELLQSMKREGVEPNQVTHQLMAVVGRHGVQTVESQQVAAAALSAVFAAAGGLLIRAGMW